MARFVILGLRGALPIFGVEMRAAGAKTVSRVFGADSISASESSLGFSAICELIYFLYLIQFVLVDVNLLICFVVSVHWMAFSIKRTGEWSDDRSGRDSTLMRFRRMFLVIAKSIKSGIMFGSVGQYDGLPEET